ncbi:mammalian cell entry protein [Mycobacterium colombiense]|uniref:Mammalian cell entry protein n=1 Tax=Mycobacterium colombiense TaxID=339268 RepID=A0A1A0VNT4_9MYCO|nr:MCE family protein [Mycobacterium colombiense]OBB84856.1 mammalian cell entry protein [Mycobacterium colombiense]
MKRPSEYNPKIIGVIGTLTVAALVALALGFKHLPFVDSDRRYTAYFAEAAGLTPGSPVQVAGFRVGEVTDVRLDGPRVLVEFTMEDSIHPGDRTAAAIKTETLLGTRLVEVTTHGDGRLDGPIPLQRTTSPYELPQALGDLSQTIAGLDTNKLNESLTTLAETFKNTPADLRTAVEGISRFSDTLNKRDERLRNLFADANKVTGVLRERSDQIVGLVNDTNSLLGELSGEATTLTQLSGNISALAQQISGLVADNKSTLRPALEKVNGVLTMIDNRRDDLIKSIHLIRRFSLSLGESVSAGPFFREYLANLVPGQFFQPFIDAAFSDLGLDPHTLLPSQLTDPQVGQPATPALPVPFPRTGQGGPPRLTVPDAITGNPGDPGCGPPGLPLPGPSGCYPYREPMPAPPPGGPPPGPPAGYDPAAPAENLPPPTPVEVNSPNMIPDFPRPGPTP